MKRARDESVTPNLPLDGEIEDALRAVYAGSPLARYGVTYQCAMLKPQFSIPLRRAAEATLRAKHQITADERR